MAVLVLQLCKKLLFKTLLLPPSLPPYLPPSFQGEVEQIALMKPRAQSEHDEGMLEFLEDIIGTSRFKEPIEELATKVEELNESRGEKV